MPDKKKFNPKEKAELLEQFGKPLNDQSLQIIEKFHKSGKDMNKLLLTASSFIRLC
ncbi:MAG: hypothetical protein JEZ01_11495 [Labilibaculum sp.]|nr:hypothetical protein [Labilibaculum sp.]MBI9058376.1 hypothetical protein [Labilibaculum sp.]